MISWAENVITEPPPPLVKHVSSKYLKQFIKKTSGAHPSEVEPLIDIPTIPRLPCHTQAVERAVKLAESAQSVCYSTARAIRFIRAKIRRLS